MIGFAVGIGLLLAVLTFHYAALWGLSFVSPGDGGTRHGRAVAAIALLSAVHLAEIFFFAAALTSLTGWGPVGTIDLGQLDGPHAPGFSDYLHFSAVSYTTLGLSDFSATGDLRLVVAMEALTGFGALTWSATFLYSAFRGSWTHR